MTHYIYRKSDHALVDTVEAVAAIGSDYLTLETGETICLSSQFEVSQTPDLSQALLAQAAAETPCIQQRINDLEELFMTLLYGGANE